MPDLILPPDYNLETTINYQTVVSQMESGIEQRRPLRSRPIREFKLNYKNRFVADLSTVQTLYNSKLGIFGAFTWLNPEDGNTYNVRFKDDSLVEQYHSYGLSDFSFNLIEVLT